jgi:hypothetical protein
VGGADSGAAKLHADAAVYLDAAYAEWDFRGSGVRWVGQGSSWCPVLRVAGVWSGWPYRRLVGWASGRLLVCNEGVLTGLIASVTRPSFLTL